MQSKAPNLVNLSTQVEILLHFKHTTHLKFLNCTQPKVHFKNLIVLHAQARLNQVRS